MTKFNKDNLLFLIVLFLVFGQPIILMLKDIELLLLTLLVLAIVWILRTKTKPYSSLKT